MPFFPCFFVVSAFCLSCLVCLERKLFTLSFWNFNSWIAVVRQVRFTVALDAFAFFLPNSFLFLFACFLSFLAIFSAFFSCCFSFLSFFGKFLCLFLFFSCLFLSGFIISGFVSSIFLAFAFAFCFFGLFSFELPVFFILILLFILPFSLGLVVPGFQPLAFL